jgi:hypothetical protein
MPPAVTAVAARSRLTDATGGSIRVAPVVVLHLAALVVMAVTEGDAVAKAAFVLFWGFLNCCWLLILRRPAPAAALSLAMIGVLILLSQFKHSIQFMTVNFIDLMVIDIDTLAFLFGIFPDLKVRVALALAVAVPAVALVFWFDPFRVGRRGALVAGTMCLAALAGLSFAVPTDPYDEFYARQYVSKFARSGSTAVADYVSRGLLEADASTADRLSSASDDTCKPKGKPPHIVMVFDESSFDISAAPGVQVPIDYQRHFQSFDGKARSFVVEGAGGPSWFTEYNVLTGLSARSYGRFADFVTRISAVHVERGLPRALQRCGYKTFSFYPYYGAFLGARRFQTQAGIEHFIDAKTMGARGIEPDHFFYNAAADIIARERGGAPLFLFTYTAANHFPWSYRFRPDLASGWRDLGNDAETDEYLRRQSMSAQDYREFVARLRRDFPGEPFLIVRFGDHQPSFARRLLDPALDDSLLARQIAQHDQKFLTTYYAIDAINFEPADLSSAVERLDAPYLPVVVQEAAGLPLDPSFAEQKRIMQRCAGLFYRCAGGTEARRFNRLLIEAGLIKGL